ncbi:MAG TPA: hypothetical protein VFL66_07050 [Gaiellaceae bacterium]|nr:hypothetical protein [Gaiellaceae bacterium]
MKRRFAPVALSVLLVSLVALATAAVTTASLSPASATFTLRPGDATLGTATETKTVGVPTNPPKADIEIAIDTTGSMGPSINDAKADALAIVSGVDALGADTEYSVISFKDAVDGSGEYQELQDFTADGTAVQAAVNGIPGASGGGDNPEAYNLVFHNSYADPSLHWRNGTRKFVIVIGDAEPHGAGSAGIPGCSDTSADPHGLNTATELANMAAASRTLMMIRQVSGNTTTSLACYQGLAAAAFTGGEAIDHGGDLAGEITSLISAAFASYDDVHLEVAGASPAPAAASWISFSPPAVGPVPAPSTQTFTLTATVPGGTPAGTYSFDIEAVADGADIGHQALTIVVPEKQLTLSPASASNPIGTSHTVTAAVSDSLGPYVGDTVAFAVGGGPAASPASGSATTDSSGTATFTFANSPSQPGTDTITATDGPLSATATKTWIDTAPSCAAATLDMTMLWSPNHKLVTVTASGVTDSDVGDSATTAIDGVTQDEPVNGLGDGDASPDAILGSPPDASVQLRAERSGLGDGRVYRVHVTGTDSFGLTCSTTLTVGVPHDQGKGATPVDSGSTFDSTLP